MVKAIVGANWGDEGKGKITDMLAETSDVVIRYQGGANAGHTIINDQGRFALHTLPSGVFYPHVTNIIGNGLALDIRKLVDEPTSSATVWRWTSASWWTSSTPSPIRACLPPT